MSEYDWHPVVALRWSAGGKLQQHWKRRVSNNRGIWYDEFDWRDVPTEQPAQETSVCPACKGTKVVHGGFACDVCSTANR